jgi:hypothetical protein
MNRLSFCVSNFTSETVPFDNSAFPGSFLELFQKALNTVWNAGLRSDNNYFIILIKISWANSAGSLNKKASP